MQGVFGALQKLGQGGVGGKAQGFGKRGFEQRPACELAEQRWIGLVAYAVRDGGAVALGNGADDFRDRGAQGRQRPRAGARQPCRVDAGRVQ